MKARMLTMALLVAALMSASMSASAQGRKGKFEKCRKAEFRKEIKFCKCDCPRCREARFMEMKFREAKFNEKRFQEARFRDAQFGKFVKHQKHGKKFHRR